MKTTAISANELMLGNWVQRKIVIPALEEAMYHRVDCEMIRDCLFYKDNWAYEPIPLSAEILERYGNGRRAITFYDEEQGPLLTATVNVPYLELKDDEVIVKDYSENEGILQSMIDNGIVSEPIDTVPLGFVEGHVCKFLL